MKKNIPIDVVSSPERVILDLRKAGFKDVLILGKYHYTQAKRQLPAHQHRQMMEICYCSNGAQTYDVNGELYHIRGGDLFVTYPGEWHGTGSHPEEKGDLYWLIIRIDPNSLQEQFLRFEGKQAKEWQRRLLQLPRHFKGSKELRNKLDSIFQLFAQVKDPFILVRIQHLLADYLLTVIDCSQRAAGGRKKGKVELIDAYLADRLDEPVVLRELADITGLSLSRFKAWFKEATGMTPLDYALRYKIKMAQLLLMKGRSSVTGIAFETGFQNAQYFATVFRKFTGMSPSEFRKQGKM